MEWLTKDKVKAAAEESLPAAVGCSKMHWHQLATAPWEELLEAYKAGKVALDQKYCALCIRFGGTADPTKYHRSVCITDATECPLWSGECADCCEAYKTADLGWKVFEHNPNEETHKTFQEAAKKVEEQLDEILRAAAII